MADINDQIFALRKEFQHTHLEEGETPANPYELFNRWMEQALKSEITDVNAMTLCTVNEHMRPSARVVLLRGVDENGFSFFTNYNSRKGKEINKNPWAALNFYWPELERQVRIEGILRKVAKEDSDEYFASRPRESRIGAWASPQSTPIENRTVLDELVQKFSAQFAKGEIPRPEHWGGYCLSPDHIEFWQGRESRLHDRILYTLSPDGSWARVRLAP